MKQLLTLLLILIGLSVFAQLDTLKQPATIGQYNRNQMTGRGLQIGRPLAPEVDSCEIWSKLFIPANAGVGKVLTSNGIGLATWQTPSGGGGAVSDSAWMLTGNEGTDPTVNFIGTIDNVALVFKTKNQYSGVIDPINGNTVFGKEAYDYTIGGLNNTAIGASAISTLDASSDGNTGIGNGCGALLSTGDNNTLIGYLADASNDTANNIIALGYRASAGNNQFAISDSITNVKFNLNGQTNGYVLTTNGATADWQPVIGTTPELLYGRVGVGNASNELDGDSLYTTYTSNPGNIPHLRVINTTGTGTQNDGYVETHGLRTYSLDGNFTDVYMQNAGAGNLVFALPPDDGDNNDVLVTNGSGTLSWQAGGGSVTLPNGRVAFGSASNTVTSDTSLRWSDAGNNLIVDGTVTAYALELDDLDGGQTIELTSPPISANTFYRLPDTCIAGVLTNTVVGANSGDWSWTPISSFGTVTTFSAGSLSPLFTTNVADPTTTPALTFSLSNAAANTYLGNATAGATSPSYTAAGALTKTDDTNVTLTLGGNPATSLLRDASITAGWTGTLAPSRGGTGKGYLQSPILLLSTTPSGHTGNTNETVVYAEQLAANTFASGDNPEFNLNALRTVAAATMTIRVYINDVATLDGSEVQVAQSSGTNNWIGYSRQSGKFTSANNLRIFSPTTSSNSDLISVAGPIEVDVTYDVTLAYYWIVTVQLSTTVGNPVATLNRFILKNNRL